VLPVAKQSSPSVTAVIKDANVEDQFKAAEAQSRRGKTDDALRVFQGIYDYTRDALALMKCVKGAYDKAVSGQNLDQNQREDLYVKLQRMAELAAQYGRLKGESAYQMGAIYVKKGNVEQARKYLPKSTAPLSPVALGAPKGRSRTKTARKKVSKQDPQVGFVIQALSDALPGGNFG